MKLLRNKSPANRALQETDVQARGRAKLVQMGVEERVLQPAVSVSVHTARAQGSTAQALDDSGFAQVCAALQGIVDPARAYKQRKPAEVMLHHLEENVLGAIESHVQPELDRLASMLRLERARLQDQQPRAARAVRRQVLPELPGLLDRHVPLHDVAGLCQALGDVLYGTLVHQLAQHIGEHDVRLPAEGANLQVGLPEHLGYEGLYEALEERVQQSITQQVEDAFAQCSRGLDALEASMLALHDVLAGQHDRLMQIKRHVRDDAVPAVDAGAVRLH